MQVLANRMPGPKAAEPLYQALEGALAVHIPENGFRPSQMWTEKKNAFLGNGGFVYGNQVPSGLAPPFVPIQQGSAFNNMMASTVSMPANSFPQQTASMMPQQTSSMNQCYGSPAPTMSNGNAMNTIHGMNPGTPALFDPRSPINNGAIYASTQW